MTARPRIELLTNPYRQIEAWYLYYLYSLDYGERNLAALQAVYNKVEEYDTLAKCYFPRSLREWDPYNIWMDVVLTKFLSPYLDDLKERVLHKRRHPEAAVSFISQISDVFMRFKSEREHLLYAALAPGVDPKAPGEFEELLNRADVLDERIKMARSFRDGDPVLTILMNLNDGKVRDLYDVFVAKSENDPFILKALSEPPVYPNYLIHWDETYPTGMPKPRSGAWMPERDYMPMYYAIDRYVHHPEFGFSEAYHSQEGLVLGPAEYGLIPPYDPVTIAPVSQGNTHSPTRWTYIEEIPPGTPGIPDNPLRLEHLRVPLTPVNRQVGVNGGEKAPHGGKWHCLNMSGPGAEREVREGDVLPGGSGPMGIYIWYHTLPDQPPQSETYDQVVARYRELYMRTVVEPFLKGQS